jgi:hypothetical protein
MSLRCLLKVLCPAQSHVIIPGCILLEENNLVSAVRRGPEFNFHACFWVPITTCHIVMCWLNNQPLILCPTFYLDARRVGCCPANWWAEPSLARLSMILFPLSPECLGNQISLTEWWVERSSKTLRHCFSNGYVILTAWKAFKAACLSQQLPLCFPDLFLSMGQMPLLVQIIPITTASRSHSITLNLVGLLWASDQPDARNLYLTTDDTTDRRLCCRRVSNPQFS